MDAVQKAGGGHAGTAMALAPVAYTLFQRIMKHDPTHPKWLGRDRFVLSAGHSSLSLYIQLFLAGYGLELKDLQEFRTAGSLTPGHPEFRHTEGVEITTGPLGSGISSAIGMAMAARYEKGLFDPQGKTDLFDHNIWVIASDGDMQEGVTSEASSLAGHQQLGNLVVIYDSNQISIEDDTNIAFTEDVAARYRAYGWDVREVSWRTPKGYVEDVPALHAAIEAAKGETHKPSLIILKTIIGWPAPTKQNTGKIHGSALGSDEAKATKVALGWDPEQSFVVPADVLTHTRSLKDRAAIERSEWDDRFAEWVAANPDRAALLERLQAGQLPAGIDDALPVFEPGTALATRAASGKVLNAIAGVMPELWGGSSDLAESNLTTIEGAASFVPAEHSTHHFSGDLYGRVLHFGIREHAMGAILNGIALHGPTRSYGGTFLIFSDYMRPAVRLAALMKTPSIFVWTHDSVALGEDGPTHQPIEQLATLRAIPGLDVVRPADANETAWAWKNILERRNGPAGIALSRQNLPVFERSAAASATDFAPAHHTAKGAYTLIDSPTGTVDVILIATGSEVSVAVDARSLLESKGIGARVVSAPCLEWFAEQSSDYRESVLPAAVSARVSVEAGLALGWSSYVGANGASVSIEHFGASADYQTLFREFGITADAVATAAESLLS
jgi:transketolase